ncbi:MAG: hypothetical protein RI967_1048 [Planctomycetota bacterium]|jgi:hypothetical protein
MHPMEPSLQSAPRAARTCGRGALAGLLASCALAGCVERRVSIETDPPGALVWINDVQVGRSPVGVEIVHDGVYDLRLEKEGYEPLVTPATAEGPLWDAVPFDFFAEILPIDARREARWVFTLVPRDDSEDALVGRAEALRGRLADDAPGQAPEPAATPG